LPLQVEAADGTSPYGARGRAQHDIDWCCWDRLVTAEFGRFRIPTMHQRRFVLGTGWSRSLPRRAILNSENSAPTAAELTGGQSGPPALNSYTAHVRRPAPGRSGVIGTGKRILRNPRIRPPCIFRTSDSRVFWGELRKRNRRTPATSVAARARRPPQAHPKEWYTLPPTYQRLQYRVGPSAMRPQVALGISANVSLLPSRNFLDHWSRLRRAMLWVRRFAGPGCRSGWSSPAR